MNVDAIGEPDQRSLLHEKADHALDHLRLMRHRLDQLRDGRRLQAGFGETHLDGAGELALRAAE